MTVTAIQAKFSGMERVAVRYRLPWPVAYIGIPGREIIPDQENDQGNRKQESDRNYERKTVGPAWKYLSQISDLSRIPACSYLAARYHSFKLSLS
jgi:hypothetical protein